MKTLERKFEVFLSKVLHAMEIQERVT